MSRSLRQLAIAAAIAAVIAIPTGFGAPPALGAQSVDVIGPTPPTPNARREPATPLPALEPGDTLRVLMVMIDSAGRPRMETLALAGRISDGSRARLTAWVIEGTYRVPRVGGRATESAFLANAQRPGGFDGSVDARSGAVMGRTEVTRSRGPMMRPGDLTIVRMLASAGRVARIESDLDTLFILKDSTTLFSSVLRIGAFDANGGYLGTLPMFDTRLSTTIALLGAQSLTGRELGVTSLRITWPATAWEGQTRDAPFVVQPVVVTDDRTKVAAMAVPIGSGGGSCLIAGVDCFATARRPLVGDRDGNGRRQLQMLVLLRYPEGAGRSVRALVAPGDTSEMRARQRAELAFRRAEEDRGRFFMGTLDAQGRPMGFSRAQFADSVFIGDRHFIGSWRRDSAQVVLVDYTGGAEPRIQSFMIPSDYPDGVEPKSWMSGDTTFTVRPRDTEVRWRQFLSRYPAIAAFLR